MRRRQSSEEEWEEELKMPLCFRVCVNGACRYCLTMSSKINAAAGGGKKKKNRKRSGGAKPGGDACERADAG
jgi:hypothetical protein